jgi:integrating conjugative element protein (TIGR03765 family)
MNKAIAFLMGFSAWVALSANAAEVVYKGRETISTQPFYSSIKQKTAQSSLRAKRHAGANPLKLQNRLPIKSSLLSPGEPHIVDQPQQLPVFIVSGDQQSFEWVQAEIETLKRIGAQGIVVEVDSMKDWRRIQQFAASQKVPINVVNGDAIAKAYNIHTYPTLILDRGMLGQ